MVANDWLAEQHAEDHRRFLNLLAASFVAHLVLVALLGLTPSSQPSPLPEILRVDLVAGLPAAPKAAAPAAIPKPRPAPPAPKQIVLPKQAPKAVPNTAPKKRVAAPARPEPIEYEDALSQLRSELGEETPADARPAEDVSDAELQATVAPAEARGSVLSKEVERWVLATQRHVRSQWITPPEFLNRGLATVVEVELTSGGDVVGTPRVLRPSGDPFYDDNAVRALMTSTPLPAPPSAGTWTFSFSEDR